MATSTRSRHLALVFALSLAIAFLPGVATQVAAAQDATPIITVGPQSDSVWGDHWAPFAGITVTIGPDSWYATADENGNWHVDLTPHDLQADQLVEATDGTTTKQHTVFDFDLTDVDEVENTVTGTADGGAAVWVDIYDQPDVGRTVTADGSGVWTSDFDVAGDGGATADLGPGTAGYASRFDGDNDVTHLDWRIPDPNISVAADPGSIWAHDFTPNGYVNVSVDSIDVGTWPTDEWGTFDGNNYGLAFDVSVGSMVAVTDGVTTETHTVTNLAITSVDEATNTVFGSADPGDIVDVWVHEPDVPTLTVTANASGDWSADFTGYVTFGPGTSGNSGERDLNGNQTWAFWRIPNPHFSVDPTWDGVWGHEWTPDSSVTLTVGGSDYVFPTNEWGDFGSEWDPAPDITAGETVTVTDGATTKSHDVTHLAVTGVDADADTVTGEAALDSTVEIWVHDTDAWLQVTSDMDIGTGLGEWTADFASQTTLVPGSNGNSNQCDTDGDCTFAGWNVPNPRFKAEVDSNGFSGWEWAPNSTVTVTIDNDTARTFDFATDEWGNFGGGVDVDVAVNQYVTATDGTSTKDMTVRDLVVTDIDVATDTVSGTSTPGDAIYIGLHTENGDHRNVVADTAGDWTATFGVPGEGQGTFDITVGTSGNAHYWEADGDETQRTFRVADPRITASVVHEEIWANDFPDDPFGQTLYYRLDDPATAEIDFESDMPLIVNDGWTEAGDHSFGRYDVQAGWTLTVRNRPFTEEPLGDGVERVLDISHIEVTAVDGDADVIGGYADPAEGDSICVWSQDNQLCSDQTEFTWNGDGTWEADFGAIGSDVKPGHWNSASQYEADGDETHHWWNLPPWVVVELADEGDDGAPLWPDAIRAEQWNGPVVTLTINTGTEVYTDTWSGSGDHTFQVPTLDIEPGHVVTLSDSTDQKSIVVEPLSVDQINYADHPTDPNTVVGTAEPHRDVRVEASATFGGWWAERWINAGSAGSFEADFGVPGNGWREQWTADLGGTEGLGRHLRLEVYDEDNDRVEARTCDGVPRIEVARSDGRVDAVDFPEGSVVTIEITGTGGTFTGDAVSVRNPENPCETIASVDLGDFVIEEGATIQASTPDGEGGTTTVTTSVVTFTVDGADPEIDTVFGTAAIGTLVAVQADGQTWRYVVAVDDPDDGLDLGYWTADFSVQPDSPEPGEEGTVDLQPGSSGIAEIIDAGSNILQLSWHISNAHFQVDPTSESLWVNEFEPDTTVTITVTREGNPVTVPAGDYVTDESGHFGWGWDPNDLNLLAGDHVEISDGPNTKDHTITTLTVDPIDPATEPAIVSGTAEAGTDVCLDVWGWGQGCTTAHSGDGTWSFTSGPGWYFELGPGTGGAASQYDGDGDATQVHWGVAPLPWLTGDAGTDQIWGSGDWSLASPITITIDDPDTLLDPDVTTTAWMEPTEWNPNHYEFNIAVGELVDLQPGLVIVATDSKYTKSLTLTTLEITAFDLDADTVSGLADDGIDVSIDGGNDEEFDWAFRVVAPSGGGFTAEFGVPGPGDGEQSTVDVGPGSRGTAQQYDEDGDYTHAFWHVPYPPTMAVVTGQLDSGPESQSVEGHNWPAHTWLTVTIDDPVTGEGADYTAAALTDDGGNAWLNPYDDVGFIIDPGFVVAMSDGTTTLTHTVTSVVVTSVDAEADKIYGTAEAGSVVTVGIWGPFPYREVTAEGDGSWVADFSGPWEDQDAVDLRPTDCEPGPDEPPCSPSLGEAWQADDDGNQTRYFWSVEEPQFPTFSVRLSEQQVHGYQWPEGTEVTLTIDDPSNGPGVDYDDTAFAEPAEWDPEQTFVWFELPGEVEVTTGTLVTMSDGGITKDHTVTGLSVGEVDPATETVTGTAEANAWVDVHIHDSEANRTVRADASGGWTADFSVPGIEEWEQETFDIDFGIHGEASEGDDDGDNTHVEWNVPEPPAFSVNPEQDSIQGEGWVHGSVTVAFDTGEVFDVDVIDPERGYFELHLGGEFDIRPGHVITVADDVNTKDHTVTDLGVTSANAAGDTVTGTAEQGSEVVVRVNAPLYGAVWEHLVFQLGPRRFDRNPVSWNEHLLFRQAVAHAIDRDALVAGIPGAGYAIDSYVDGFLPELSGHAWAQYAYDPVAAADLVGQLCRQLDVWDETTQSCTEQPTAVFSTVSGNADRELLAELLYGMLGDAGIAVEIRLLDDFFSFEVLNEGWFDIGEWAWLGEPQLQALVDMHGYFDPANDWENYYRWGTADSAVINANTARFAELVQLMQETDDAQLLEGYIAEAEQILADELPFIPLYVRAELPEVEGSPTLAVTADELGNWEVDFSGIYDIEPGQDGTAAQPDDDGDSTFVDWRAPGEPEFGVTATHDWIEVYDFEGNEFTFTIDDEDAGNGVLYEGSFETEPLAAGHIHVIDDFDIEAGQFVTVTDGITTKTTRVSPIEIEVVDHDTWVVDGVADPYVEIDTFAVTPFGGFGEHMVQVDENGRWTLDLKELLEWPDDDGDGLPDEPLPEYGLLLGGGQRDEDSDRTIMFWDPVVVEGHVYVDGDQNQPVGGAEVFLQNALGSEHTCTDDNGFYRFDDASLVLQLVRPGIVATGRAVEPDAAGLGVACSNADFLYPTPDGQPLLTGIYAEPFDLWDGYEQIDLYVRRAAAYQTVVVEEFDGMGWIPVDGVPVRAFDASELGDPADWDYAAIWDSGDGEIMLDFTGVYLTEDSGTVEMRYAQVSDVLTLVEYDDGSILGDITHADEFEDRGDGVHVGPTIVFPNQAPVVVEVSGPIDPIEIGVPTTIGVTFTDRNVHDTHEIDFDWGDGTSTEVAASGGAAAADVTYDAPGVYEVTVTVTDSGGLATTTTFQFVVVYDPDGGFVTGGGWINPEDGSVYPGVGPDDKVNFGFNVRYEKGDPDGEFNVQLGSLHLHSDAMDWLVITLEEWAHFMGVATVDGSDEPYPFRVDVRDGGLDGTMDDRLEMSVWAPGADLYADDPLYVVTGDLGGGQIKIHRK